MNSILWHMRSGMYGLRTDVHLFQGFWDCSSFRYFVGVNGMPLIWFLLYVDRSLFCNTLGGVLWSRSWLLCLSVCVVSSIWLLRLSVCASECTLMLTTAWFLFAFHWFKRCACLLEGDGRFLLGAWMATSPIVAMGFSALTVTTLALTCKFQVNYFPLYLHVSEGRPIQSIVVRY